MFAPALHIGETPHRLGECRAVGEAQRLQALQAAGHVQRAERQFPDEQADIARIAADVFPRHRPGHLAARAEAAFLRLDVIRQAPVQLALQHQPAMLAR
ncbi:hypothetical protein D3C76_1343710 [compost metagenome]